MRRSKLVIAVVAAIVAIFAFSGGPAMAHEGHEHDEGLEPEGHEQVSMTGDTWAMAEDIAWAKAGDVEAMA